ncbi:sensor histidine kinase [Natronorubrum halophilum]|uniref:sensor histidine kinase n=1 Tax=Natronorubrum halophilum TaxID=1702106 RepID=UPI000EF71319|nr:HAMP domain-containing sensor histidine kinase [Natronorubrum halophilum]
MPRITLTDEYLGAAVIIGLGMLFLIPLIEDWIAVGAPVTTLQVTMLFLPLVYFGVLLWYVRWRLGQPEDNALPRIAVWFLLGALLTPLLVGFSLLGQEQTLSDIFYVTNRAALRGGVIFLIIGHYSANNQHIRDQLEERTQQLEFVNRLLRHDIRNDVMVIIGYAEMIADQYRDERFVEREEISRDPLQQIEERADRIAELANMASRLDSNEDYHPQRIWLVEMLETTIDRVQAEYPEAEFDLVTTEEGEQYVAADDALKGVFENLLRNAVQHNDQPTPQITATIDPSPETVTVRVTDNGPGLPESMRSTFFDPGVKGSDSSGSGLGLYLVETLIDRYNGDIWVEENDPRGATFVIELDRYTEPAADESRRISSAP